MGVELPRVEIVRVQFLRGLKTLWTRLWRRRSVKRLDRFPIWRKDLVVRPGACSDCPWLCQQGSIEAVDLYAAGREIAFDFGIDRTFGTAITPVPVERIRIGFLQEGIQNSFRLASTKNQLPAKVFDVSGKGSQGLVQPPSLSAARLPKLVILLKYKQANNLAAGNRGAERRIVRQSQILSKPDNSSVRADRRSPSWRIF